jgi:hypothetical protein
LPWSPSPLPSSSPSSSSSRPPSTSLLRTAAFAIIPLCLHHPPPS